MSQELSGILRAVRLEVAPQIPDLAPQLANNELVIRDTVCAALGRKSVERGVDHSIFSENNLNKLERTTFISFLAAEQLSTVVEDEGVNARFSKKIPAVPQKPTRQPYPASFDASINMIQYYGYEAVKKKYSDQDDQSKNWWAQAGTRYKLLGKQMEPWEEVKSETESLEGALRSKALQSFSSDYITFINERTSSLSTKERVQAAHDLSYLLTSQAGGHILDIHRRGLAALTKLQVNIAFDEKQGKYIIQRHPDDNWREVHARAPKTAENSATMQCPVHTSIGLEKSKDNSNTTLETYIHAAINLAADYRLFGRQQSFTKTMLTKAKRASATILRFTA